jgi:hypothetical protein
VLDEMGERRPLRSLVSRSDVVSDVDRDEGQPMVLHEHDLEAIGE